MSWPNTAAVRTETSTAFHSLESRAVISDRTLYKQLRNPIWTGYRVYSHKRGEKRPSRNGRQADRVAARPN